MQTITASRYALSISAAAAFLIGCGSQPLITAPGAMPQAARSDSSNYKVVYNFSAAPNGEHPYASLIDVGGTLYGTTAYGGSNNYSSLGAGTVFRVTTGGKEKVLHDFGAKGDGTWPFAAMTYAGGTLYGTTYLGGSSYCPYHFSSAYYLCGTVFSIAPSGAEKVLYNFGAPEGDRDGNHPVASVVEVNGTLYGTTQNGGKHHRQVAEGCGTVFSVTPSGTENVLHSFSCGKDGGLPAASLIEMNGTLYGTTVQNGVYNGGTVFSITPSGREKVLHSFGSGTDGAAPSAGLIAVNGTFYGTTSGGGTYGGGTVFSITPSGMEKVLHSFGYGTDGVHPLTSLLDVKGTLYGTTQQGGAYSTCNESTSGCGTVFSITTSGTEKVLHSFGSGTDGIVPSAALIDMDGTLYGTTANGGTYHRGTVFALKP